MTPIEGLSFQLYSARTLEPLEAQFELLAGLGYKKVEPFGGLLNDPQRLKGQLELHGLSMPTSHVGLDRLRADCSRISAQATRRTPRKDATFCI